MRNQAPPPSRAAPGARSSAAEETARAVRPIAAVPPIGRVTIRSAGRWAGRTGRAGEAPAAKRATAP